MKSADRARLKRYEDAQQYTQLVNIEATDECRSCGTNRNAAEGLLKRGEGCRKTRILRQKVQRPAGLAGGS